MAVFLRYLRKLSPEHQQIWKANALNQDYKLHPAYYRASILGEWGQGITIFAAFLEELRIINEMCLLMEKPALFRLEFRDEKRPQGFGFLIRPTLREFNNFVHLLDKMLSDNLNKDFFRGDIDLEEENTRKDGKVIVIQKGTIRLLEEWLNLRFKPGDKETAESIKTMMDAFKQVRKLRQEPAHAVNENEFDQEFFSRQRQLMESVYVALMNLRNIFQQHPNVGGYKIPNWLLSDAIWIE